MSNHHLPAGKKTTPLAGLSVRQPIVSTHGVTLLVVAFLTLLTEFGVPLTLGQQNAITKFIAVAGFVVAGWLAHRKVTPIADPRDNHGRRLGPQPTELALPARHAPNAGDVHSAADSGAGGRDDAVSSSLDRLFGPRETPAGRHHLVDPGAARDEDTATGSRPRDRGSETER